ncbi:hypothetical protein F4818DRAFT_71074 [Hypoxylon cercidicola]|nr:hypothetical protein F4818DRAFT_71074 [Hypoxylon cercidicola]
MIRHPLRSAVGRSRPDLNRVTDGIAASLRQFSVSARRSADDDDDSQPKPTRRQRSAAAADELISILDGSFSNKTPATSSASRPVNRTSLSDSPARGPNIISVQSLPRSGALSSTGWINEIASSPSAPSGNRNVIRGKFIGRGRGGGNFAASGRMGGGWDDRPQRARGGDGGRGRGRGRGGGRGGGRGRRRRDDGDGEFGGRRQGEGAGGGKGEPLDNPPRVQAHLEQQETGRTLAFNPSLTLESLAGYGPAVATSGTPFGQGETVLRQARVLGGGEAFHPTHLVHPDAVRAAWRDGTGVFVPPTPEARQWVDTILERMVAKSGEPFGAPAEVKQAVLEDALLGRYDGPRYADPKDALATVRSYVKRDGTWNAQALRGMEAKIRSLLERRGEGAGGAAGAKA